MDSYIYFLVYRSYAIPSITPENIESILRVSRRFNANNGISGLLIYRKNSFVQVLEGMEDGVTRLYDKIKKNFYHHSVETIAMGPAKRRSYGEWPMAFLDEQAIDKESSYGASRALFNLYEAGSGISPADRNLIFPLLTQHYDYCRILI